MAGSDSASSGEGAELLSTINITPFVDVVLVLLVIFMVTTPVLMKDLLEIHLPKTQNSDGPQMNTLGIILNQKGQILLNGKVMSEGELSVELKKNIQDHPETQAVISADVEIAYGKVTQLIDLIKSSGIEKFALQIEKITENSTPNTNENPPLNQ